MKQVICPCDGKLVSIMPCKVQSEAMASRAILQGLKVNSPVIELSESFFMLFYFQVIFFSMNAKYEETTQASLIARCFVRSKSAKPGASAVSR